MCVSGYLFISGKIKMDIMKFTKITMFHLKCSQQHQVLGTTYLLLTLK